MRYFAYLQNSNMPHNSLQKEISSFLKQQSNRIVDDVDDYKIYLKNSIRKLSEKYTRCKPISAGFFNGLDTTIGLSLSGSDWSAAFYLYQIKEEA